MLNIIGHDFSQVDKDTIKMIFGLAKIEEHELRIIDLKHEDIDVNSMNAIFAVGKTAIRLLVRSLVKSGKLGKSTFVGNDMYNREAGFLFINVAIDIATVMTSQESKDFLWSKIQLVSNYYKEMIPFDDNLEALDVIIAEGEDALLIKGSLPDIVDSGVVDITYDTQELMDALYEMVNLSDPGLTKSLSKYEKFDLNTSAGVLSVYPTTRTPTNEEGFFLSFKDLILLLKFATVIDTDKITIEKRDGTSVS